MGYGFRAAVRGRPHVKCHAGVATTAGTAALRHGHLQVALASVARRQCRLRRDGLAALQRQVTRKVAGPIGLLGVGERNGLLARGGVRAGVRGRPSPDEGLHAIARVGVLAVVVGQHHCTAVVARRGVARVVGVNAVATLQGDRIRWARDRRTHRVHHRNGLGHRCRLFTPVGGCPSAHNFIRIRAIQVVFQ